MAHYIKTIVDDILNKFDRVYINLEGVASRFRVLIEEVERLDPRDFIPAHRFAFINIRRRIKNYQNLTNENWTIISRFHSAPNASGDNSAMLALLGQVELAELHGGWADHPGNSGCSAMAQGLLRDTRELLKELTNVLESYIGTNNIGKTRLFAFISDPDLRHIVERDYRDLTLNLFPVETWKSVVIIAGSILEALLYDLLTRDNSRAAQAMAANAAPKKRTAMGTIARDICSDLPVDEWSLNNYIEVAEQLALLPMGWKASVQAILRDFRNCVHPRRELKMTDKITQGEAFQSVGALMRICDHIEKTYP